MTLTYKRYADPETDHEQGYRALLGAEACRRGLAFHVVDVPLPLNDGTCRGPELMIEIDGLVVSTLFEVQDHLTILEALDAYCDMAVAGW